MKILHSLLTAAATITLIGVTATAATTAIEEPLLKSEYSYRRYTTQDGLSELYVHVVYQDRRGFIWAGTHNGCVRYDGTDMHSFMADTDVSILGFSENERGDVFALGIEKVCYIPSGTDSLYIYRAVTDDRDMYLWNNSRSLPSGYGLYKVDNSVAVYAITDTGLVKRWEHELLNNINYLYELYWDREMKQFYIPADDGVLYVVAENGTVLHKFENSSLCCFIRYRGKIWAVGRDGLYVIDGNSISCAVNYPFYKNSYEKSEIREDAEHNLIISTSTSLLRFADGRLELLSDALEDCCGICIDREDNVWVAGSNGLLNYFNFKFKNYRLSQGILSQEICLDSRNRLWITCFDGRLLRVENDATSEIKYPRSPNDVHYFNLGSTSRNDDLLLSGSRGVLHLNIKNQQFRWLNLPQEDYFSFCFLSDDEVAVASLENLYIVNLRTGKPEKYTVDQVRQNPMVFVVSDGKGRLAVGGQKGVTWVSADRQFSYQFGDSISNIRQMMYDNRGVLWFTSKNRLVSIDQDGAVSIEHTFPDILRAFTITSKGVLIASTVGALYLSYSTTNINFLSYDRYNGFDVESVLQCPPVEDRDGYVWLLTHGKIVRFDPDNLFNRQVNPLLYLPSVQTSSNNVEWRRQPFDNARFDWRHKNVRFSFTGLCYSAVGNIRYHYRLLGFQNDWSDPSRLREVTFNNLPPGDYTFEIYADAGTDESRSEVQTYSFSIRPAFWQTVWFLVTAVLLLMLASALVALYFYRRKNRALLERLETEKQLNELRISAIRLKAIPHFNANVLAAIEYYLMNHSKDEALRLLGIYSNFTFRMLSEVDRASRTLSDELEYVKMYLELEKLRFIDKFDYRFEVEEDVNTAVQLPNMILHTYCENAVKHGFASYRSGGMLVVRAIRHGDMVMVSVEDNGVGRAAASQNKNVKSTKQGLDILMRQIEIYNRFNDRKIVQRIDDLYDGDRPCGTRFSVDVPQEFSYI